MYKHTHLPRPLPGYEHIRRYWDHHYNSYVAKILPGEFYVTYHDEILMTVVGSCVAACIRDSITGIGGMNHFMLPTDGQTSLTRWQNTTASAASRYGSVAMESMINEILKYGGRRDHLEIKLFGGGKIMANIANIGQQNINFVRLYVKTERLNLLAEDLGGIHPRKILYFPTNGRVRVKKLRAMEQTIAERENAYRRHLEHKQATEGDVDLFE